MMTKLRSFSKFFLYLLVVAFIALMVFEWGADFNGGRGFQANDVIGVVNGQEIKLQLYETAVSNAVRAEQQNGATVDAAQESQIRNRVWESMVQEILLSEQVEKMGINVTDEQVSEDIINNPDPQTRQNPALQTNGVFDPVKYRQILAQPGNAQILMMMEQDRRANLPFRRLVDFLAQSVVVTEQELRDEYADQNVKAKVAYLHIPVAGFRSDAVKVSDDEIAAYYEENKDDYKAEEKRQVKYIFLATSPTAADTALVYEDANYLISKINEGEDFVALVKGHSDDPTAARNDGDLGYFDRNTMVKEFTDAAFSAAPGAVIGPVKTQFGLHIIKIHDKKVEDGVEKVHASHILLNFETSVGTLDERRDRAEEFAELAGDIGFDKAADSLKVEVQESVPFGDNRLGAIPGVGRIRTGMDWDFHSDKGAVSRVYSLKQPDGYAVMQLIDITPEGFRPMEDVKNLITTRLETQKRTELARQWAAGLASEAKGGDFKALAAQYNSTRSVRADTTDTFPRKAIIPGLGRAAGVAEAAFKLPVGSVSDLLEGDRGFYFIKVLQRDQFNEETFAEKRSSLRNTLSQRKLQTVYQNWYNTLKDNADIQDLRYKFYTS